MSGHLTNSTYPSSLTVSGGFTGVVLTRTICTSLMNTLECMTCFKTKKGKRGGGGQRKPDRNALEDSLCRV